MIKISTDLLWFYFGEKYNTLNMKQYKKALKFIAQKHKGQTRKMSNSPYIIHLIRVSQEVSGDFEKTCALLHDTLEDTDTTITELEYEFWKDVARVVDLLTHRKWETYMDYIKRVKADQSAINIKIADISDNLSDTPSEHAIEKCSKALDYLIN